MRVLNFEEAMIFSAILYQSVMQPLETPIIVL